MTLTHLDADGRARMVDVGEKGITRREAIAEGRVLMSAEAFGRIAEATATKGDVVAVAELAGVMGAKRTAELIPLCHQVPLEKVAVAVELRPDWPGVLVTASARATAKTGIEMEALVAVGVACLTVYDMVKAVDRGMRIEGIRVVQKEGGASGSWRATDRPDPNGKEG